MVGFLSAEQGSPVGLAQRLLLIAGDVESNPGPNAREFRECASCIKTQAINSQSIKCHRCTKPLHKVERCSNVKRYVGQKSNFIDAICNDCLTTSHIEVSSPSTHNTQNTTTITHTTQHRTSTSNSRGTNLDHRPTTLRTVQHGQCHSCKKHLRNTTRPIHCLSCGNRVHGTLRCSNLKPHEVKGRGSTLAKCVHSRPQPSDTSFSRNTTRPAQDDFSGE